MYSVYSCIYSVYLSVYSEITWQRASPGVLCCNIGELIVPVGFSIKSLLFEPCDWIVLRLVVNPEVSGLSEKKTEFICVQMSEHDRKNNNNIYHKLCTKFGRSLVGASSTLATPRSPSSGWGRCCSWGSRSRPSPPSDPPETAAGLQTTQRPASPGTASRSISGEDSNTKGSIYYLQIGSRLKLISKTLEGYFSPNSLQICLNYLKNCFTSHQESNVFTLNAMQICIFVFHAIFAF